MDSISFQSPIAQLPVSARHLALHARDHLVRVGRFVGSVKGPDDNSVLALLLDPVYGRHKVVRTHLAAQLAVDVDAVAVDLEQTVLRVVVPLEGDALLVELLQTHTERRVDLFGTYRIENMKCNVGGNSHLLIN